MVARLLVQDRLVRARHTLVLHIGVVLGQHMSAGEWGEQEEAFPSMQVDIGHYIHLTGKVNPHITTEGQGVQGLRGIMTP